MKIKKTGKIIALLIIVLFSLSLTLKTNNVSAFYNWVEWEGTVTDDWGNTVSGATVKLKRGSTTLETTITDGYGEYEIREYVDTQDYLTLHVSKADHSTESVHVLSRDMGDPWPHDFTIYYVEKWAVIVGIDIYVNTSDLDFCENDAEVWHDELTSSNGFDFDHVSMYQDSGSGCNGRAEEKIVKGALIDMVNGADAGDIIVFIFAGHGKEVSESSHVLAMWDYDDGRDGEDGYLYDTELMDILDDSIAERVFLFFDCCYGSKFEADIDALSNEDQFFLSGADQQDDVWVDDINEHGCWTQCFLNEAWADVYSISITMGFDEIHDIGIECYDDHEEYNHEHYDANQHPTGVNFYGIHFCLSKAGITSPN